MGSKPEASVVARWLDVQRQRSGLSVQHIPFSACRGWKLDDGRLRHASGRFFSVAGFCCSSNADHLDGLSFPMIDQPEIGILGFVVRLSPAGWQWMLQAKTEPGNVGGTQVGPTVQATRSNYCRVHGGKPTPMLDLFIKDQKGATQWIDVEQSEQGDRFLGKYNRNAVVLVDGNFAPPDGENWQWFLARDVLQALHTDFAVNTDARSVLWCSDWAHLLESGENVPFARWRGQGGFGERLLDSFLVSKNEGSHETAMARLHAVSAQTTIHLAEAGLEALPGWYFEDMGIVPAGNEGGGMAIQAFSVFARDREVISWSQPLLVSRCEQRVVLACTERAGLLHFALTISVEPGFREKAQFGPSWVSGLGHANPAQWPGLLERMDPMVHATVLQSDEGGRFMNSVVRYTIIELPSTVLDEISPEQIVWVTLSDLRRMAASRGLLNNELRSVLSLLLYWV